MFPRLRAQNTYVAETFFIDKHLFPHFASFCAKETLLTTVELSGSHWMYFLNWAYANVCFQCNVSGFRCLGNNVSRSCRRSRNILVDNLRVIVQTSKYWSIKADKGPRKQEIIVVETLFPSMFSYLCAQETFIYCHSKWFLLICALRKQCWLYSRVARDALPKLSMGKCLGSRLSFFTLKIWNV